LLGGGEGDKKVFVLGGGGAGSGEVSCKSEVLRGADVDTIIIHFMQGSNI